MSLIVCGSLSDSLFPLFLARFGAQTFLTCVSLTVHSTQSLGHGFVKTDERLRVCWNSQKGSVFVDGAHMEHDLVLGDIIELDGHAASLNLYAEPPQGGW